MNTNTYPNDLLLVKPLKFLGATVLTMNANLGLGTASSSLNLNLILDCEDNDYFAPVLDSSDPRYIQVGDAVYFRLYKINDPNTDLSNPCVIPITNKIFEFGGVLTSWTVNKSSSGLTYSVKVDDPRILLDNTAIVIDTFSDKYNRGGDTIGNTIVAMDNLYDKPNYINVYQYFEGLVHDGYCKHFGTGGVLENAGMPYNKIIEGLKALDIPIYSSTYDPQNKRNNATYKIQWDDLKIENIPNYFRISGNPKITMSSLLSEIADLIAAEYYVYLQENPDCSNNNLIRIGFIPLNNNPPSFKTLIDYYDNNGAATELSYGQELRAEKTKTILIGSNVHRIAEYPGGVEGAIPFFGFDEPDVDPITNTLPLEEVPILPIGYDKNGFYISKKMLKLNSQLNVPIGIGPFFIHELDIRAAMASCDAWLDRVMDSTIGFEGSLNFAIRSVFNQCIKNNRNYWNALANNNGFNGLTPNATVRALVNVLQNPKQGNVEAFKPGIIDDLEKIHNEIASLGQTYYAKQYLIPLANIIGDNAINNLIMCGYRNTFDTITGEWQFTAEPTTDGGWADIGAAVLGLADPYLQMFRNEDGRINAFARFRGGACGLVDLNHLNDDEAIATNDSGLVYVKADIDPKIVVLDITTNYYLDKFIQSLKIPGNNILVPCVIFKLPAPCVQSCGRWFSPGWASTIANELQAFEDFKNAPPVQAPNNAENADKAGDGANAVDITSLNNRGYMAAAVRPDRVAIPLKFNNQVYGPWGSSGCFIDGGGVEVIQQTDLNPWTYGSIGTMTAIGSGLVSTMNRGLLRAETGSATVLGLPSIGNLGAAFNSNGPILSSINFSYGNNGVTSQLEFKTYTPKFGTLSKVYVDRFKEYSKQRLEYLKKIKNTMLNLDKLGRRFFIKHTGQETFRQFQAREGSLGKVLIGQMTESYGSEYRATNVGLETLYKSNAEMVYEYGDKSYMSLDAFFGPTNKIFTPRPSGAYTFGDPVSYTKATQPPSWRGLTSTGGAYNLHNMPIEAGHLFPLTNPNTLTDRANDGTHKGHTIDLVGRNGTVPESGLCNNILPQDDLEKYANDYRYIAMRGPIVLQSWGYDTNGHPIPNQSGDDNLSDYFATDWLQKPQNWPVAPIDLRYDRDRKVWVSPPAHRIVTAQLLEFLAPDGGKALGKIIDNGPDGGGIDHVIVFKNNLTCPLGSGTKVYAYYDTYDGYYIALTACSGY